MAAGRGAPIFVKLQADGAGENLFGASLAEAAVLPLPVKPKLSGRLSVAWSIARMYSAFGVQVVAQVPVAGPVPPPIMVVRPAAMASWALLGADEMDVGVEGRQR